MRGSGALVQSLKGLPAFDGPCSAASAVVLQHQSLLPNLNQACEGISSVLDSSGEAVHPSPSASAQCSIQAPTCQEQPVFRPLWQHSSISYALGSSSWSQPNGGACRAPASMGSVRGIKAKISMEYQALPEPRQDTYTTEPTNYAQLLGALRYSANVARIAHLVDSYSHRFDGVHVAAALTRLPKLAKYREEDMVQGPRYPVPRSGARPRPGYVTSVAPITQQLLELLPGGLTQQAGDESGAQALQRAEATAVARMARMHPREVSNIMWALGTLRAMGVPMDLRQVKGVTEELLSLLSHKNYEPLRVHACPMDVAMLLKGLSLLKHRPKDKGLLPALARFAETHASSFTAQDIQMVLASFASMGVTNTRMVDALAARAAQIPREFPPQGIATVLRALADTVQLPDINPSTSQPSSRESSTANQQGGKSSGGGSGGTGSGSLSSHPPAAVSPRKAAVEALVAGIAPQITLMQPSDLAAMADAMGKMASLFATSPASGIPSTSGDSSATSSSSSSTKGLARQVVMQFRSHYPAWLAALLDLLCDKAVRDLDKLTPQQAAPVLSMVASLQWPHLPLLNAAVNGVLSERHLDPNLHPSAGSAFLRAAAWAASLPEARPNSTGTEGSSQSSSTASASSSESSSLHPPTSSLTPLGQVMPGGQQVGPQRRGAIGGGAAMRQKWEGEPLAVRARLAAQRVKDLYASRHGPLAITQSTGVVTLLGALVETADHDSQQMLQALVQRAMVLLEPTQPSVAEDSAGEAGAPGAATPAGDSQATVSSDQQGSPTPADGVPRRPAFTNVLPEQAKGSEEVGFSQTRARFDAQQLADLLGGVRELGPLPDAPGLAAAAARHLRAEVLPTVPPALLGDVLPAAVDVLAHAEALQAGDAAACRAVAQAYVQVASARANKAGQKKAHGGDLPEITSTASGLVPHWYRRLVAARQHNAAGQQQGSPDVALASVQVGTLLAVCQSSGALDAPGLAVTAARQVLKALPKAGQVSRRSGLALTPSAMVQCFSGLLAAVVDRSSISAEGMSQDEAVGVVRQALEGLAEALPKVLNDLTQDEGLSLSRSFRALQSAQGVQSGSLAALSKTFGITEPTEHLSK